MKCPIQTGRCRWRAESDGRPKIGTRSFRNRYAEEIVRGGRSSLMNSPGMDEGRDIALNLELLARSQRSMNDHLGCSTAFRELMMSLIQCSPVLNLLTKGCPEPSVRLAVPWSDIFCTMKGFIAPASCHIAAAVGNQAGYGTNPVPETLNTAPFPTQPPGIDVVSKVVP